MYHIFKDDVNYIIQFNQIKDDSLLVTTVQLKRFINVIQTFSIIPRKVNKEGVFEHVNLLWEPLKRIKHLVSKFSLTLL